MPVDTTYSYFSSPDDEILPTPTSKKYIMNETTTTTTRLSYPDIVSYNPTTAAKQSALQERHTMSSTTLVEDGYFREEWVTDYSYGYFECPSMVPEPSIHRCCSCDDESVDAADRKPRPTSTDDLTDGYSYFGI
jgi:hypothetical protein